MGATTAAWAAGSAMGAAARTRLGGADLGVGTERGVGGNAVVTVIFFGSFGATASSLIDE